MKRPDLDSLEAMARRGAGPVAAGLLQVVSYARELETVLGEWDEIDFEGLETEKSVRPSGPSDIQLIRFKWRVIVEELHRGQCHHVATCVSSAWPKELADGRLCLALQPLEFKALAVGDWSPSAWALSEAIRRVTGISCDITLRAYPVNAAARGNA